MAFAWRARPSSIVSAAMAVLREMATGRGSAKGHGTTFGGLGSSGHHPRDATFYTARFADAANASIDASVANTVVVNTLNTDLIRVGDVGTVASATGNTSVNGTWQVTSVVANTSITFTSPTSTTGSVTGTPTLRFTRPTGVINANVTFNPLGDYNRASATQRDVVGSSGANWISGVGLNTAADGTILSGLCALIGTDAAGGECIYLDGDSQIAEVRDGQTNGPSAQFSGDSSGNLGWLNRAMYTNSLPSIRTAIPSMKAQNSYTKNDDKFRLWLAGFCDRVISEMGRNDAVADATYSGSPGFIQHVSTRWDRFRSALRGKKYVIACTLSPASSEVGADHWKTGRNPTYQTQPAGPLLYPTGYVYANYHVNLRNGTLVTGATGGVDGFIDQSYLASNLDGSGLAEDGYFAVDGVTDYRYCVDGTHFSKDGHAGIAAQITSAVLRTAKVIT
jgi:hypothetical protein